MKVEDIEKVSRLARVRLSPEELERFSGQLTSILEYFARLQEVETQGVVPASHPTDRAGPIRPDEVEEWPDPERLVEASNGNAEGFFVVPRIL